MIRATVVFLVLISLLFVEGVKAAVFVQSEETGMVSVSDRGEPGNGISQNPSISSDGRFVAFESEATNLQPGDTNGHADIYVYDRQAQHVGRITITTQGVQGNGDSTGADISGNGRVIAFQSDASNLVPGDTNRRRDIFTYDRLTNAIRRVSVGADGRQADGDSRNASIAFDGRYLAFESQAGNLVPGDDNGFTDIYIFDQVTGNVLRASVSSAGQGANGASFSPVISGDGRLVVFISEADNLVAGDSNGVADIFVYHRVLQQTERVSVSSSGFQAEHPAAGPDISHTGRNVTFSSLATIPAPGGQGGLNIFKRDRQTGATDLARPFSPAIQSVLARISPDGQALLFLEGQGDDGRLLRAGANGGPAQLIAMGDIGPVFDVSENGRFAAYDALPATDPPQVRQVYVAPVDPLSSTFYIAGRVTDPLGTPLALVTITDSAGVATRTDADGYFYLSGYPSGAISLTPEKEGYAFEPPSWNLSIFRDVAGYHFSASNAEKVLEEARKDLGMPYSFNRGCENGEEPCGGPYHGFYSGFCTDLVLDAYTFAVNFDIDFALEHDAYAHPTHFYRWRNARNTHDMWRYFHYSGQMIAHEDNYQPGDIVFFDWSGDGEIDHVALVSEVESGRPSMLVDATGVIDQNPSGLATELEWLSFHENTVRGHARWSGMYEPIQTGFRPGTQVLQMALAGSDVFLRLVDSGGNAVSFGELDIPGGAYFDLEWEEVVSVLDPGGSYTIEIRATGERTSPYQFTIQTLSDGLVTERVIANSIARPLEVRRIDIAVSQGPDGALTLDVDFGSRQAKIRGLLRKK